MIEVVDDVLDGQMSKKKLHYFQGAGGTIGPKILKVNQEFTILFV